LFGSHDFGFANGAPISEVSKRKRRVIAMHFEVVGNNDKHSRRHRSTDSLPVIGETARTPQSNEAVERRIRRESPPFWPNYPIMEEEEFNMGEQLQPAIVSVDDDAEALYCVCSDQAGFPVGFPLGFARPENCSAEGTGKPRRNGVCIGSEAESDGSQSLSHLLRKVQSLHTAAEALSPPADANNFDVDLEAKLTAEMKRRTALLKPKRRSKVMRSHSDITDEGFMTTAFVPSPVSHPSEEGAKGRSRAQSLTRIKPSPPLPDTTARKRWGRALHGVVSLLEGPIPIDLPEDVAPAARVAAEACPHKTSFQEAIRSNYRCNVGQQGPEQLRILVRDAMSESTIKSISGAPKKIQGGGRAQAMLGQLGKQWLAGNAKRGGRANIKAEQDAAAEAKATANKAAADKAAAEAKAKADAKAAVSPRAIAEAKVAARQQAVADKAAAEAKTRSDDQRKKYATDALMAARVSVGNSLSDAQRDKYAADAEAAASASYKPVQQCYMPTE